MDLKKIKIGKVINYLKASKKGQVAERQEQIFNVLQGAISSGELQLWQLENGSADPSFQRLYNKFTSTNKEIIADLESLHSKAVKAGQIDRFYEDFSSDKEVVAEEVPDRSEKIDKYLNDPTRENSLDVVKDFVGDVDSRYKDAARRQVDEKHNMLDHLRQKQLTEAVHAERSAREKKKELAESVSNKYAEVENDKRLWRKAPTAGNKHLVEFGEKVSSLADGD